MMRTSCARLGSQLEDNLGAVGIELAAGKIARLHDASALPVEYPGWFLRQFDGV